MLLQPRRNPQQLLVGRYPRLAADHVEPSADGRLGATKRAGDVTLVRSVGEHPHEREIVVGAWREVNRHPHGHADDLPLGLDLGSTDMEQDRLPTMSLARWIDGR